MTTDIHSSDIPDASSGDLVTAAIAKEAGITVYLMEELTDARLRCEQVKKFVSQAIRLVASSSHRDHFYEVAGDVIYGLPDSLFKLDKALAATALAASRLDYEELKAQLKPEKVTELEDVLRNVRLRQIDRRAPFIQPNQGPPKLAKELEIKDLKSLQLYLEGIMTDASKGEKDASPELKSRLKDIQQQAAKALKTLKVAEIQQPQGKIAMFKAASQNHIASALRRIAAGVESGSISPLDASIRLTRVKMALAQTAQEAIDAMGPIQGGSREEVMKGFKSANPDLTEDQLEEIADQWEKNKDVVKDKHQ